MTDIPESSEHATPPSDTWAATPNTPDPKVTVEAVMILASGFKAEQGPPRIESVGPLVSAGVCLVSKHRIKNVVLEQTEFDNFLGMELPGRRIRVEVRVDVELQCWLELSKIQTHVVPDFPDTFRVSLPAFSKVAPVFPDDEWADYKVEYGAITIRNPEKAKEKRKSLYRAALEMAEQGTWQMTETMEPARLQLQTAMRK